MSTRQQAYLPVYNRENSFASLDEVETKEVDSPAPWEEDEELKGRNWWLWSITGAATLVALGLSYLLFGPQPSLEEQQQQQAAKLHLLLPLTPNAHSQYTCKTTMSAIVHGYEPIILNWNSRATDLRETQNLKIKGVLDFLTHNLTSAQEDDLVLMIDSTDVWLQQSPWVAYQRFYEILPKADKVLVGGDSECWPNDRESTECWGVPDSPLPPREGGLINPRWVNSGTVMGSAKKQTEVFRKLQHLLETKKASADQSYFNTIHYEGDLLVDYYYRLFWSTTAGGVEPAFLPVPRPLDGVHDENIPFELLPPMISQLQTGEFPVLMHLAHAFKKLQRNEYWGKFWWSSREPRFRSIVSQRLTRGKVRFAHDRDMVLSFEEFCPPSMFDLEGTY